MPRHSGGTAEAAIADWRDDPLLPERICANAEQPGWRADLLGFIRDRVDIAPWRRAPIQLPLRCHVTSMYDAIWQEAAA